jgi:hypothetical protein
MNKKLIRVALASFVLSLSIMSLEAVFAPKVHASRAVMCCEVNDITGEHYCWSQPIPPCNF